MGIFSFTRWKKESLDKGLEKTKESVFKKLSKAIVGKTTVDAIRLRFTGSIISNLIPSQVNAVAPRKCFFTSKSVPLRILRLCEETQCNMGECLPVAVSGVLIA